MIIAYSALMVCTSIKTLLLILGGVFIFPLYFMITLSLKPKSEFYDNPFGLPRTWVFSNFSKALSKYHFFLYFKNSVIYTGGTVFITIVLGSMLAYCLSRMNWKFGNLTLSYISMGLVIPLQVTIIPLFMLIKQLGIKDNYFGLLLPYSAFSLPIVDGNFGSTAAMAEMLLQSHAGEIHLLPALPASWRSGRYEGLRARGNIEIGAVWQDGCLIEASIKTYDPLRIVLRYGDRIVRWSWSRDTYMRLMGNCE